MISVVCVVNNKTVFENNISASLREQDVDYELLVADNVEGQFQSIPKALNEMASKAKHDYIMCVHQDVFLIGKSWLRNAEKICNDLEGSGVFGVAGVNEKGAFVGFIVDRGRFWGFPLDVASSAFTLDECLLLIKRETFLKNKFDEGFAFHSYAADLCLRIKEQGSNVSVIPSPIYHNSATVPILEAGNIEEDDLTLYRKHRDTFSKIIKTTGNISSSKETENNKDKIDKTSVLKKKLLFLDANSLVLKEFTQESSLLDVGVIPLEQSWIKKAKKAAYSVGVSEKKQYLLASKIVHIHDDYVLAASLNMPFRRGSFSVVLIKGLLEYLTKEEGAKTIANALEIGAEKGVIVTPNKSRPIDTAYEFYLSKWEKEDFEEMGFKVSGLHLRLDIIQKVKIVRALPFLKPILARLFPNRLSRDLLCIKQIGSKKIVTKR